MGDERGDKLFLIDVNIKGEECSSLWRMVIQHYGGAIMELTCNVHAY
jgi:hypothetical protein